MASGGSFGNGPKQVGNLDDAHDQSNPRLISPLSRFGNEKETWKTVSLICSILIESHFLWAKDGFTKHLEELGGRICGCRGIRDLVGTLR
jgi:hypothetical protein